MSGVQLSFQQLDELAAYWTAVGLDRLVASLEPGLPRDRAESLADAAGLALPEEVLTWFAWHNGAARQQWTLSHELWSLEHALGETTAMRQVALSIRREPETPLDDEWQSSWLALTGANGHMLVVDCAASSADHASPVFSYSNESGTTEHGISSLGRLVELAIELFEAGYFTTIDGHIDTVEGRWPSHIPDAF